MNNIVVPYINPDLDGVACAIAISVLESPYWEGRLLGNLDRETLSVLDYLRLPALSIVSDWTNVQSIWLVDTHHVRQLPTEIPRERVIRITDHHTHGDPQAFPNAIIQNEMVGAAATLVAEKWFDRGGTFPMAISILLQAAIISNTLEFRAFSTSDRDRRAFERMSSLSPFPLTLTALMQAARSGVLALTSSVIVEMDCKSFDTPKGLLLISQVEASGALELLDRNDLRLALSQLKVASGAVTALLNLVDTQARASAIISTSPELLDLLARNIGARVDSKGNLRIERLLQRKSDIVPHVLNGVQNGPR